MVNVRGYISSNFTKSFLTIFLPIYLIISVSFLIKIFTFTNKINLMFHELLQLYIYSIPEIIFFTLPFTFVTALSSVLGRLSQDNELIALYALGINSKVLLRSLFFIAFLFSMLLLSVSFISMPLMGQTYKAFKEKKFAEASFNITPGKIGEKFGDFYIYVKDKQDKSFQNLVIYNQNNQGQEQFFSSQKGELLHENGTILLKLTDGYGYTYNKERLQEAKYKELKVYDQESKSSFQFKTIPSYWAQAKTDKKRMHQALFYFFVSLIPLLSVYFIAAFTIINPRYQRNHTILTTFSVILMLYLIASILQDKGNYIVLLVSSILLWFTGKWLFEKRVARYF